MPGQVIQAILMPVDTDISVLKELYGDEWFREVRTDWLEKFDQFTRFTQRDEADFSETARGAAFHLVDADRTGGYFVCGTLKAEKEDSGALLLPFMEAPTAAPAIGDTTGNQNVRSQIDGMSTETHHELKNAYNAYDRPDQSGKEDHRGLQMTKEDIQGIVSETVAQEVRNILAIEVAKVIENGLEKIDAAAANIEMLALARQTSEPSPSEVDAINSVLSEMAARLKKFEGQLKAIVQKQESLEYTAFGRPSLPEDPSLKAEDDALYDPTNAFKGMFDRVVA